MAKENRTVGDHRTAHHEAGHAVTTHHLRRAYLRIWVGSIERRGQYGGIIALTEVAERDYKPRSAMIADIAVSLGSRVAELLVLETMGNGHMGDGPAATAVADTMIRGGLGTTLSALAVEERRAMGLSGRSSTFWKRGTTWPLGLSKFASRRSRRWPSS